MGWRYYCDYCDKTFKDDLESRKKHLTSSLHVKLRKLHYEKHRDPRTILAEESIKTPCRRYIQHGECQFSGSCKYTHYSSEDLWQLKQQIAMEDYERACRTPETPEVPTVESWLETYDRRHGKTAKSETEDVAVYWSYPDHLECRTDLPPSLRKFKPEDFEGCNFEEWGV